LGDVVAALAFGIIIWVKKLFFVCKVSAIYNMLMASPLRFMLLCVPLPVCHTTKGAIISLLN
jgi:hypothetical protein